MQKDRNREGRGVVMSVVDDALSLCIAELDEALLRKKVLGEQLVAVERELDEAVQLVRKVRVELSIHHQIYPGQLISEMDEWLIRVVKA